MLYFANDYCRTAHPDVLRRLLDTSDDRLAGYGEDVICASAARKIREAAGAPDADVFFISGGTQTNQLCIDSLLQSYEGAVCADTGHINVHEAGAIEYTSHGIIALPGENGLLDPGTLEEYMQGFEADESRDHMIQPRLVYLSHPTELGTLYSLSALERMREVCDRHGLLLYIDGARLGYALACPGNDVTLQDLSRLCDAFYIGGTKCGTMTGEALVFPKGAPRHFITLQKQHGAMLAKGWINGLQFDALFEGGAYVRICEKAIRQADRLRAALKERGFDFFVENPTNQVFVLLTAGEADILSKKIVFTRWSEPAPGMIAVRFCTSWATEDEEIEGLVSALDEIRRK